MTTPCTCHPGNVCASAASCAAARRVEFGANMTTPQPAALPELLRTSIAPKPLRYSLNDYHNAPSEGPLHATWEDKPHRLLYDLIAAVSYYSALQAQPAEVSDVLAAFDEAIAQELPRVSHIEYDSHEICKHFAAKVRAILALRPQAVPMTEEQRREIFAAGYEAAEHDAAVCQVPPHGWRCTRKAGHEGPCAAVEADDAELVQRGMDRLRGITAQGAQGGEVDRD